MRIVPVVLSGGAGTRLWPASRLCYPKQFLPLTSGGSLLQNTLTRFAGEPGFAAPVVVGAEDQRFLVASQAMEAGITLGALLVEPMARDTAFAIAAAADAVIARDADALMFVMPADHLIQHPGRLAAAVRRAAPVAAAGHLVTFGIAPTRAETGYGYVEHAEERLGEGVWRVRRFIEKPERAAAERFLASGRHFWNSGAFLFSPAVLLAEMERYAPAVAEAAAASVRDAKADLDFVRLDRAAMAASPKISIDYALMQVSDRVAVVPVDDLGWSDIGSWDALYDSMPKDERGNSVVGEALLVESERNFGYLPDGRLLVGLGVSDLVVASTPDVVLVARRDMSQRVKEIVEQIRPVRPDLVEANRLMYRPWGHYECLHRGDRHQVKHICVKPGGRLSLQKHYHRAEHWVVVKGTARVTRGDEVIEVTENQSIYLPLGVRHRLENPGRIPLSLVEVQTGSYLGEDDIERFEDTYGRS